MIFHILPETFLVDFKEKNIDLTLSFLDIKEKSLLKYLLS